MDSDKALIIVDMFNRLDFPGAEDLAPHAIAIAGPIAELSQRVAKEGGQILYCNDAVGEAKRPDQFVEAMLVRGGPSAAIAKRLYITAQTRMVVKSGHSGFFKTDLDALLKKGSIRELTVVGMAADLCVLATAIDGAMRGFEVCVDPSLIAAESQSKLQSALTILKESFGLVA
jgi:nicotinamidase-related amidase